MKKKNFLLIAVIAIALLACSAARALDILPVKDVKPGMKVVEEEIFGPVVVAMPFDDLDQVVAAANNSIYGLGASIWTRDLSIMHRVAPALKAGSVWVNCHSLIDAALPFGGYKQSGWGRENGRAALDLYLENKSVCAMI